LPDSFGNLSNLEKLSLQDNFFVSLPSSISAFNGTHLYLGGNQLKSLPNSIGQNRNLEELYFERNMIFKIPAFLKIQPNYTFNAQENFFECPVPDWATSDEFGKCYLSSDTCRSSSDCSPSQYCKKSMGNCRGRGMCVTLEDCSYEGEPVEACSCSRQTINARCPQGKNIKNLSPCV